MADLYERSWPVQGAKGAVVIVHGLAEHSGRYEWTAGKLNAAGYDVFALDLRGHGQSVGFPGDMGGDPEVIYQDVVAQCVRVAADHERTFLLGHSMGTMISMPAVTKMPSGTLRGLILSGVAAQPGEATGALVEKGAVPPETVSRDPDVVQAYIDDPLVFEKTPPELLQMLMAGGANAIDAIPLIDIPVLLVHGTADKLCDIAGANMVHTQLVGTDKTLIAYDGLYHEVLNEPEKDKVIADVIAWIDQR